jgi:hypothetical protein
LVRARGKLRRAGREQGIRRIARRRPAGGLVSWLRLSPSA